MILIELTAAINATGTTKTFYLSSEAFVTRPTDTPANVAFIPALLDPGSLGVAAYSDGRTGGGSKLEVGEIVVANSDGQFDAWLTYGFDGRPLTIRSGTGGAYPADFPAVLAGTVESIEADFEKLVIRLRDRQYILQKPVLATRYKGDNTLPTGLEGTAADLKDKPKPRVLGKVFNIAPPQVNTAKLTYQVSNGPVGEISAVYDRGAALTKGADYATSTAMQAASPSSGTFITCLAEGYFRLGSLPAGQVTADVTEGRRNLLTWSEDFPAGWSTSGVTVSLVGFAASGVLAPNGADVVNKIEDSNATSTDVYAYRTLTIPNDTKTYTFSVYLKAGVGAATNVDVALQGGSPVLGCTNAIGWAGGTLTRSGAGISSLTPVGDGWYRLAVTLTNNLANNTQFAVSIRPAGIGSGATGHCYAWGAQLEIAAAAAGHLRSTATPGIGRSVGEILNLLAAEAGAASNSAAAAALDAEIPAAVGIYLDGEESFQDAMDQIAAGVGAYYAFDADGRLNLGRLTPPLELPRASIRDHDCLDGLERRPAKDTGLPIWRATVRHAKNWTTQGSDLAGAVSADRRAYLAEAYRDVKAESPSVKNQYLMAGELTVESLLTSPADAVLEAQRLLALHQARRDIFDAPVPLEAYARWVSEGLRMMDVVYLTLNRFGLGTGKAFRLIGVRLELAQQRAILSVWG